MFEYELAVSWLNAMWETKVSEKVITSTSTAQGRLSEYLSMLEGQLGPGRL